MFCSKCYTELDTDFFVHFQAVTSNKDKNNTSHAL